ncbi:MAG TPA: hypothetical protein VGB98_20675 [Pyrinomonadaceae bacterium]|jgi:cell division protein FtsL
MLSMGVFFVVFTTLLLCGGVAFTLLWFRQAVGRPGEARVKSDTANKGWRRL